MKYIKMIAATFALDVLVWATPKNHDRTWIALHGLIAASLKDYDDEKAGRIR